MYVCVCNISFMTGEGECGTLGCCCDKVFKLFLVFFLLMPPSTRSTTSEGEYSSE